MHSHPATRSRIWILGPWQDLSFIVGAPLLIYLGITVAQLEWSGGAISSFVLIWAIGHHLPGMMRAYGDPQLFRRYRARFILAPLFLMAIAVPSFLFSLGGVMAIAVVWGWWHYLMQTYGFVRIYDAKIGSREVMTRRLDKAMCIVWFLAAIVVNDNALYGFLDAFSRCGVSMLAPSGMDLLRDATVAATVVVTAAFFAHLIQCWWHGRSVNPVKLLLMATTFAFFWYAQATRANILVAYALFEMFHDVQYLTIVWAFNRNRVRKDKDLQGFTRFLFRPRIALIGLYLLMVFGYGALDYGNKTFLGGQVQQALLGVFLASALLHYYYDGFIWKLRDESTQVPLDVEPGDADATHPLTLPSWLVHGLCWCLFIGPLFVLSLVEMQELPGELDRARQLVAATPGSAKAQVRMAQALERAGEHDAAIEHLETAVQLQPAFEPVRAKLVRMLIQQGHNAMRNGRYDQAVPYFRRAQELAPDDGATRENLDLSKRRLTSSDSVDSASPRHESPATK